MLLFLTLLNELEPSVQCWMKVEETHVFALLMILEGGEEVSSIETLIVVGFS